MGERSVGEPNGVSLHPHVTVYGGERSRTAAPLMLTLPKDEAAC